MLNRTAYSKLIDWKRRSDHAALLVDGARQTGKTFLIEEFARREYPSCIKVDFLHDSQAAAALSAASSADKVIEILSLISGRRVETGKTLVFFDEVQEAQSLVTFSKYLVEDGRFPLVMSGSLLGVELHHVRSFPVGYLYEEMMYPLSLMEFFEAIGIPASVMATVGECFHEKRALEESVHERLIDAFRLYLVIGGMPRAVQEYLDSNHDLGAARAEQENLVALYRDDIAKHAGNHVLQVNAIFDALPSQLDKENKRFLLSQLSTSAKFDRYANDFAWITGARAALKTNCVRDPKPMLERSAEINRFKLYQSDVGMLMSRYDSNVALAALAGARSVNFGSVYENVVAQELAVAGVPLHYYAHSRLGEVDFMAESAGRVLPIEVKSGKGYKRHVALNNLLKSNEYDIDRAYVLSEANVSHEEREGGSVWYLPLYMLPFVAEEVSDRGLNGVSVSPPSW